MKTMPSEIRGLVNCFLGFALVMLAAFGRFPENHAVVYVTTAYGLGLILYSLLSDYEPLARRLARPIFLVDLIVGATLVASPWLFGFSRVSILPQVLVGLLVIGNTLIAWRAADRRASGLGPALEPDGHLATWSRMNRVR
jgi:hypothetical protein